MKILYFGGQKSGKSKLAEEKTLMITAKKPFYIATYIDNFNDQEMKQKINSHKLSRNDNFNTIEEGLNIASKISKNETYIIDCISTWLFNNIDTDKQTIINELETIFKINSNVVFVLNDISLSMPTDEFSRKFVNLCGEVGQFLAANCDEVYEVKYGIEIKVK